jgi:hypothetical protein
LLLNFVSFAHKANFVGKINTEKIPQKCRRLASATKTAKKTLLGIRPGTNPTTSIYNGSVVEIYNATNSLTRFWN